MIYMKNCKKEHFMYEIQSKSEKKHPDTRQTEIFQNFQFCGICVGFAIYFAICV